MALKRVSRPIIDLQGVVLIPLSQSVGWIIWRDESYLPKHLVFELHYLGGTEESYTLNFSRPGAQIIAQYYNLIHLGFEGFRAIMENCM